MSSIEQKKAIAIMAAVDPVFANLLAKVTEEFGDDAWRIIWGAYSNSIIDRFLQDPSFAIAPIAEMLEQFAVRGTQSLKESICTEVMETFLHLADNNKEKLTPLLKEMGPECKAYMRAYDQFSGFKSNY